MKLKWSRWFLDNSQGRGRALRVIAQIKYPIAICINLGREGTDGQRNMSLSLYLVLRSVSPKKYTTWRHE